MFEDDFVIESTLQIGGEIEPEQVDAAMRVLMAATDQRTGRVHAVVDVEPTGTEYTAVYGHCLFNALHMVNRFRLGLVFGFKCALGTCTGRIAHIQAVPHVWNMNFNGTYMDVTPDGDLPGKWKVVLTSDDSGTVERDSIALLRRYAEISARTGIDLASVTDFEMLDDPIGRGYMKLSKRANIVANEERATQATLDKAYHSNIGKIIVVHCGLVHAMAPIACVRDREIHDVLAEGNTDISIIDVPYEKRCCWWCGASPITCPRCRRATYCSEACRQNDESVGHDLHCGIVHHAVADRSCLSLQTMSS